MDDLEFAKLSHEMIAVAIEIDEELAVLPPEEHLRHFKQRVAPYPVELQNIALVSFRAGLGRNREQSDMREREERKAIREQKEREQIRIERRMRLGFLWGIAFFITLIVIALWVPYPTPWQYTLFRIILAVSAAGFTNYIEGMLRVQWKFLRATGPLAVLVVIYFFSPAALVTTEPSTRDMGRPSATPLP